MDINKKVNIEVSTNSIIKVLIVIFLLWIIYLIRDVVAILFFAIILVSILEPMVTWMRNKKIPKVLAVLFIYLVLIAVVALIIGLLIPPIATQVEQLSSSFPHYWEKATNEFSNLNQFLQQYGLSQRIEESLESFSFQLPEDSGGIFSRVSDFFSGIFSVFVILIITFYMLVEENAIKKVMRSIIPTDSLPYAYQLFNRIQVKLGLWLRGQLILGLIIFCLVFLGLTLLGIKYALVFAIIAGLLEFIPYLGPIISGTIAVTLTLFQSPVLAILVLFLYLAIQFVENNFLVPQVMRKAVGLNPIVSILALLIGGKLGGLIGVIIAIPLVTALSVFVQDFFDRKRDSEMQLEK